VITHVDLHGRQILGRALTWDTRGVVSTGARVSFPPGSVNFPEAVPALREHSPALRIGTAYCRETDSGLHCRIDVWNNTHGDHALGIAYRRGYGLSIGWATARWDETKDGGLEIISCELMEVSLVRGPVWP
jgi:phage head maturation protease